MNETRVKKFSSFFFFLLNIFYGEKETLWSTRLILSCIYVMCLIYESRDNKIYLFIIHKK